MKVKVMQVGPIGTNCYILEDEATNKAAVIDPGDEGDRILSVLKEDGVQVEYILLTHGHYDHTTAVPDLIRALPQAEVYIHQADANGAGSQLFPLAGQVADLKYYNEGDTLTLGSLTIQVLHTPGHSKGSVNRLGQLEGDFHVCPGHDRTSTLERERQYNPFLREAMGQ